MVSAMWGGEWQIRWLDEVDSTNTSVRDQARQGAAEGLVVVADHQTAGRGRLDRTWESPPGANLLASVLLRPQCEAADVHLCTEAVALAAADACREVAGVEPVLKWPNDLLVGGRKLAGVLAEAEFSGGTLVAVIVGIGINVAWPGPDGAGRDLPGRRGRDRRSRWTAGCCSNACWARSGHAGPCSMTPPGGASWPTRCAGAAPRSARSVRVVLPGEELTGLAAAIDDDGTAGGGDGVGTPAG